ncbi:competence protein ComGB [Salirhabdus euzebyi]|uniref:Competence protein ComGB n=1 Tax=Salirhabdus euzebyi TaxID=394506 RepID=A0A841Q774_9BACI|nr:competence type IV pilus assembly protein ComGB [Salirhabdus euzebyi]MBB6454256.1 competence protein ComGB [Salirhabdus euzebyi]
MLLVLLMKTRTTNTPRKRVKLSLREQQLLLNRLTSLLKRGYSLNKSLQLIALDQHQHYLAKAIMDSLSKGEPLDLIFKNLGFSNFVVSFLYFSRSTGNMDVTLINCMNLLKHQQAFQEKFKKVMQYPSMLLLFLVFLFISLKLFVIPSLHNLYKGFQSYNVGQGQLVQLFNSINYFINSFFIIFFLCCGITLFWKYFNINISPSLKIKIYSKTPIVNKLKSLESTYLFSYHFSSLLDSGISIKNALQIMSEQQHLPIIKEYSISFIQTIYKGDSIKETIEDFTLLENEVGIIFERNLHDGTLAKDLRNYADILVDTITTKMLRIISFIQPIIYILFGGIIVTIYFSILYPMFEIMKHL